MIARAFRLTVAMAAILASGWASPAAAGPQPSRQELPAQVLDSLRGALVAYDDVRAELIADRLAGVPDGAVGLAASFREAIRAQDGLGADVAATIDEAARAAESMAKAGDLTAARAAFGEVSRLLMLLVDADPRLAEGWHFFSCPMTEGFGEWMQPHEDLENPYMGPGMLICGTPFDRGAPEPDPLPSAGSPGESESAGSGPEFKPGIPGLRMVDVRDHKFLWREIEELQLWEQADRISVSEFRSKAIEKTANFLGLDAEAAREFSTTAGELVASLRRSFLERRPQGDAGPYPAGLDARFPSDLADATVRLSSLLGDEPRHQLFAPDGKKWLLRLAFGPKESREPGPAEGSTAG